MDIEHGIDVLLKDWEYHVDAVYGVDDRADVVPWIMIVGVDEDAGMILDDTDVVIDIKPALEDVSMEHGEFVVVEHEHIDDLSVNIGWLVDLLDGGKGG